MGATETTVPRKKSNSKLVLTTERIEVDSALKKYEFREKASHFDENECSNSKEKSSTRGSIKRGPQSIIEGHKEKMQKIDRKAVRKFCNKMHSLQKDTLPKGAASCLDSEHGCYASHLPSPVTDSFSREESSTPIYDGLLSPKKAIRVAALKRGFADTFRKAQNELSDQSDPAKLKLQKERERMQQEAARTKADEEFKQQIEKEREDARVKIQKIERTVEIHNDLSILEELEMLCGSKLYYRDLSSKHCSRVAMDKSRAQNPLERLGLFLKDDYITSEEAVEDLNHLEEGEICY